MPILDAYGLDNYLLNKVNSAEMKSAKMAHGGSSFQFTNLDFKPVLAITKVIYSSFKDIVIEEMYFVTFPVKEDNKGVKIQVRFSDKMKSTYISTISVEFGPNYVKRQNSMSYDPGMEPDSYETTVYGI